MHARRCDVYQRATQVLASASNFLARPHTSANGTKADAKRPSTTTARKNTAARPRAGAGIGARACCGNSNAKKAPADAGTIFAKRPLAARDFVFSFCFGARAMNGSGTAMHPRPSCADVARVRLAGLALMPSQQPAAPMAKTKLSESSKEA